VIAVDTSAIVAIAFKESEARAFAELIGMERCLLGWPTALEAHLVLSRVPRRRGLAVLAQVLSAPRLDMITFGGELFEEARLAFDRYGRRGRHKARLNFGDCMAYAVAKAHDVPLLYKGTDFASTDIRAAFP
jgi:ribonuclease VapC